MSSSESGSGSESEEEFVSIIATRERRANAGSRLRQLLQAEEDNMEEIQGQRFNTEDDENVNLLFQEGDGDQDFVDSEEESEEEEEEDDDEDDAKTKQKKKPKEKKEEDKSGEEEDDEEEEEEDDDDDKDSEPAVDSDDYLSDSDISGSDTDESEGERELEKQEKAKKKKKAKAQIPAIIRPTKPTTPKDKSQSKPKPIVQNVDLLSTERRTSSRKTTVENKVATAKKLQEQEERRVLVTPKPTVEYVEKTFEERMLEAEETERQNKLSLSRFFEQEVDKKKKQRELAANKKRKMVEYIRVYSHGEYITPLDEINEIKRLQRLEEEEQERIAKRRKRYPRKKKSDLINTAESITADTTKDAKSEDTSMVSNTAENEGNNSANTSVALDADPTTEENKTEDLIAVKQEIIDEGKSQQDGTEVEVSSANTIVENQDGEKMEVDVEADGNTVTINGQESKSEELKTDKAEEDKMKVDTPEETISTTVQDEKVNTLEESNVEATVTEKTEKKVTFDIEEDKESKDTPELLSIETLQNGEVNEETGEVVEELKKEEEEIPQGPPQFVAVNYISLEEFDNTKLTTEEIKRKLFGEQSTWPANRRSAYVEHLYVIKSNAEDTIESRLRTIQNSRDLEFEKLRNLPKFGQIQKAVESVVEVEEDEEEEVVIKTPAPVGIYLPNGTKKKCLITGTSAAYYDPQNGVPYSSVDSFKTLRDLQDDSYFWTQVDNGGSKSRFKAGVGCYFGKWNGRHAKGVPEGF